MPISIYNHQNIFLQMIYTIQYNLKKILIVSGVLLTLLIGYLAYGTYCDSTSFIDRVSSGDTIFNPNYDWTCEAETGEHGANKAGKFAASMYTDIYSDKGITDIINNTQISISDEGCVIGNTTINTGSLISGINKIFVGIATTLFAILWIGNLITSFLNQQGYAELIIKKLMVLALGIVLIVKSSDICVGISNFAGGALVQTMSGAISDEAISSTVNEQTMWNLIIDGEDSDLIEESTVEEDSSIIASITTFLVNTLLGFIPILLRMIKYRVLNPMKVMIILLLPWMGVKISQVLCTVVTYTRAVEIILLCTFSPIPFALLTNEPLGSGSGARYLKNVAAVSLQGAVMVVVSIICHKLMISIQPSDSITFSNLSDTVFKALAIQFAHIGLLMKALSIAQKVLGLA